MNVLDARLLAALRASQVHLPATDLASQLAAPLATVEARLAELRQAGFEIEERPGLGFRLVHSPDRLIADDLHSRLGSCELAREIVVFTETGSTNDSAMQRGLWFSLLLRPTLPYSAWPRLTTWAAVSLAATIENSLGLPASIKWPNDIYLTGRKIAGILAESGVDVNGQPFAVVGIGVNVNQNASDFPAEIAGKAASLGMVTGRFIDRPTLAANLLRELDTRLAQLTSAFPEMVAEAARRSLLLGRWVQIQSGHHLIEGRAEELDPDGQLLLRTNDGALHRLSAGEVTVIAN